MTNYLFHVHTYRCKHAENIAEEEYVKKAVSLGYKEIYFSDHCPFPEDPFTNRMKYSELQSYIDTLQDLKNRYADKIKVFTGVEAEYIPEYKEYYDQLREKLDFLLLGQHFYKKGDTYSFALPKEEFFKEEHTRCADLMIKGINTGLFDYVAHPDRIFRRCGAWNQEMETISKRIISAAITKDVKLEQNRESRMHPGYYREEFWELITDEKNIVQGVDAHYLSDF